MLKNVLHIPPFWKRAYLYYFGVEVGYNLYVFLFYHFFYGWTHPFYQTIATVLIHLLLTPLLWVSLYYAERRHFYLQFPVVLLGLPLYIFAQYNLLHLCNGLASLYRGVALESWKLAYSEAMAYIGVALWFDVIKTLFIMGIYYLFRFYDNFKDTEKRKRDLQVLNQDLQLGLLKQQLNPHFYFNTLNNLYGLAMTHSDKTAEALAKLETLMHYILEDCQEEYVRLDKEIAFIGSYIELEKLRYSEKTRINWLATGELEGKKIVPMLLIQLVENGFKHGLSDKDADSWLEMVLEVKQEELYFSVQNSKSPQGSSDKGGLGIAALQKRLQSLYPQQHELHISESENSFKVLLHLRLI